MTYGKFLDQLSDQQLGTKNYWLTDRYTSSVTRHIAPNLTI